MATWVPLFGVLVILAVIAGIMGKHRTLPGLLAGSLVAFFTSAGTLGLSYFVPLRPASRRALDLAATLVIGTFFVLLILWAFGRYVWPLWWPKDAPFTSWWFQKWFFVPRVIVYFFLLIGAIVAHGREETLSPRILLAPLLMIMVTFDMLIGPAPFWIATLVWVPLICLGAASGGAFAIVMTRLLHHGGEITDADEVARRLAKATLRAALLGLVGLGIVLAVGYTVTQAAGFRVLVEGDVRVLTFASVGALAVACGLLAARRSSLGAVILLAGYLAFMTALMVPRPTDPYALAGVLGAIMGPLFGLATKLGARMPAPRT